MENTPLNYIITLIKDIVLITGSLTATYFTIKSFSKWKKEHKGKIKYDLSRKLLKSVYDLKDDFQSLRSPLIHSYELPKPNMIADSQNSKSEEYKYIFENRLKYLQKSYNTFLSLLPEVKIDFGSEINYLCDELVHHITTYRLRVGEYIQLVDNWDYDNPYNQNLHDTIYNSGENNETTISFDKTAKKLEQELLKEIKKL